MCDKKKKKKKKTIWYGALSVIPCISYVDSSPNLWFFFFIPFFVDETWLPTKKYIYMPSDISRINFHIRSTVSILAGNRDTVNQSKS